MSGLLATPLRNTRLPFYNHPELGHDYSDKTYTGWSPRLSAFWTITPKTALFVNYIVHDGLSTRMLIDELLKAADRGVRVRILLDDTASDGLAPF